METGLPDDPMRTPTPTPTGGAEVHTRITTTQQQDYSSGGEQSRTEQVKDTAHDVADQARERASGVAGQAREKAEQLRGRAGELSSQAQEKLSGALSRAQDALEERGLLDTIRQNPLPALGLAFGAGFLLAGSDDSDQHGTVYKAKNQLKGAIMGGLSAAVAQEARSMMGMGGSGSSGGFLSSILENLSGSSSGRSGGSGGDRHRPPSHQEMR